MFIVMINKSMWMNGIKKTFKNNKIDYWRMEKKKKELLIVR